jgi:ferrochelatase
MKGIWLIQLGTPEAPTAKACRKFLKEFLMDEKVIDIPFVFRWLLVHLLILPSRPARIAKAYQSIWREDGSPLRVYSESLAKKLQEKFGASVKVELSMRYGEPSIPNTAKKFEEAGIKDILVVPLYPQYAEASTGTSLKLVRESVSKDTRLKEIQFFYAEDFYIKSVAATAVAFDFSSFDHILMSYHGLPERQIQGLPPEKNYLHHCKVTTEKLISALNLPKEKVSMCFQSRLGRTPWIKPFTDKVIVDLAKQGKKKMAVFCPSFVADCLETVEEIQIRNRKLFQENGGEDLVLIPSLNDHPLWVEELYGFLR